MNCSAFCMFCESEKKLFINRTRYHGVCLNHSSTNDSLYKCTHCAALVPILASSCTKCFNRNIFPVTSEAASVCYNCIHASIPQLKLCDYCENDQGAFKGSRCDHSLCASCYKENFEKCPICEYNICIKCEMKIMQVADLSCHQVCIPCFDKSSKQCPSCFVPVKEPEKFHCAKCLGLYENINNLICKHQICDNCLADACPVCKENFREIKSESQELNKEDKSSKSENSEKDEILAHDSEKDEILAHDSKKDEKFVHNNKESPLSTDEKINKVKESGKLEKLYKKKHSKLSPNSEIQLVNKHLPSKEHEENDKDCTANDISNNKEPVLKTEEISEFNPLLEKKEEKKVKGCEFYSTLFLLIIFYLCTLCFCFSCLCNCFQGFKAKKMNNSLYLFCLCKSKSLTQKLWISIIKCECTSRSKEY